MLIAGYFLGAVVVLATASSSDPACALSFDDIAAEVGLRFVHDRGATGRKRLPETMGSGVAWLDFDGDGWLDLYAVQSGPLPNPDATPAAASTNRLFRNLGPRDDGSWRFVGLEDAAGAGDRGYGQGVVVGDLDGNGWVDLYVTNFGSDALYLNRGGRFDNATSMAGLGVDGWSSSAALGDVDGDGRLDLYIARYLEYDLAHDLFCGDFEAGEREYCGPELFAGASDRLYRNLGVDLAGRLRFADITAGSGLGAVDGKGLGVVFTDLDGDGLPDLYVANDQTINFLFRNRTAANGGEILFEDLSFFSGAGVDRQGAPEAGMGVAVGDVDGDGLDDLAVTNFDVETNTLYRQRAGLQFEDVATPSGFGLPSFNRLGFGVVLADLDLDGDLDAYIANGHVRERVRRESSRHAQPDLVLLGDGAGRFEEAPCAVEGLPELVGRGLAAADYDGDGDVDLALSNSGGPLQLLRNGASGHWLGVRAFTAVGAPAIGTEAVLRTADGVQRRVVIAGDSYQSSGSPYLRFGLSPVDDAVEVETLEIRWPGGQRLRLADPPLDVELVITAPAR